MTRRTRALVLGTLVAGMFSWVLRKDPGRAVHQGVGDGTSASPRPVPAQSAAAVAGYAVVQEYPHDPLAFTQGLLFHEGALYEGTGINGASSLRQVTLATGAVTRITMLPAHYFGEGIALLGGKLYQLTWRNGVCFVYDAATFEQVGTFDYPGEGWGLTTDGTNLIMSDGTSVIRFIEPTTFRVERTVTVRDAGRPVEMLNELEYVKGEILANVWRTDRIVRIDPRSGSVLGWIDLSGLLPTAHRTGREDVLNGIAYDADRDRLFVTGKYWPKSYEITLVAPVATPASASTTTPAAGSAGAESDVN